MSVGTAPFAVVVGATDLDATAAFLARFGFEEVARRQLPAEAAASLYDLDGAAELRELAVPGSTSGSVRLVATPHEHGDRSVFALGPLALDLYSTDVAADRTELLAAGVEVGPVGTIELGPLTMHQCEVIAPDGWRVVLVESNHRRPSVLTEDPDRRHSEVHSLLWTVRSIPQATAPFVELGLTQAHVFPITHPALTTILSLPRPDVPMVMNLLVDPEQRPVRLELVEFPGDVEPARHADGRLRGGVHAVAFHHAGDAAPAGAHELAVDGGTVHVGVTDAGVRYELWTSTEA